MMDPRKTALFNHAIEVFKEADLRIEVACPDTGVIWVKTDFARRDGYRYQSTKGTWAHGLIEAKNLRNEPDPLDPSVPQRLLPEELVERIQESEARYDA